MPGIGNPGILMVMSKKIRLLFRAAFVICLVAVLYLALDPAPFIAGTDSDKVNHVLAFFTLGVLLRMGWPRYRLTLAVFSLILLGGGIEIVQNFTGRDASFGDLGADAIGLLLAVAATSIFRMSPAARVSE